MNYQSILTCEATAILKALEIIHTEFSEDNLYIIYTDSKSCLTALQNPKNIEPMFKEIKEKMINMLKDNVKFEVIWIPSHQGIIGNEKVDKEAKIAAYENEVDKSIKSYPSEIKKYIKHIIKISWDSEWKENNTSKLSRIRNTVFDRGPTLFYCRKDQVVITRLRIGHTNLTHIHLITKSNPNKCKCGLELTVSHLLVNCVSYQQERMLCKLPSNLMDCLNEDGYVRTIQFLKTIDVYKLV